jgi:hypothetical protein
LAELHYLTGSLLRLAGVVEPAARKVHAQAVDQEAPGVPGQISAAAQERPEMVAVLVAPAGLAEVSWLAEMAALVIRIALHQPEQAPTARQVLEATVELASLAATGIPDQAEVAAAADIMAAAAAVAEQAVAAEHGLVAAAGVVPLMPIPLRSPVSALQMGLKPGMERSRLFIHSMAQELLQVQPHPLFATVQV